MQVRVQLYGTLRRFSQPDTPGCWTGELPEGSTVGDLLEHLGIEPREVAAAAVDGKVRPLDTTLPSGAEVVLVTPIGGG